MGGFIISKKDIVVEYEESVALMAAYILCGKRMVLVGLTLKESRKYTEKVLHLVDERSSGKLKLRKHNESLIMFKNDSIIFLRSFGRNDIGCRGLSGHLFIIGPERGKAKTLDGVLLVAAHPNSDIIRIALPKEQ